MFHSFFQRSAMQLFLAKNIAKFTTDRHKTVASPVWLLRAKRISRFRRHVGLKKIVSDVQKTDIVLSVIA
ncbi:hypothetical protein DS739_08030 [Acetobacter sp. JWB]|nr:hypothetical protein CPF11_12400 [Acetobacter pomorum]AXC26734.1 hypothetical protein DS739_08030 [Acetobacter sp. JWB]